jgi:hypothetical protein
MSTKIRVTNRSKAVVGGNAIIAKAFRTVATSEDVQLSIPMGDMRDLGHDNKPAIRYCYYQECERWCRSWKFVLDESAKVRRCEVNGIPTVRPTKKKPSSKTGSASQARDFSYSKDGPKDEESQHRDTTYPLDALM